MVEFKKLKLGYIAFAKLKKKPKEKRWQKLDSNLLRIVKNDEKYVITVYWDTNSNYIYGVELEDEFYLTKKEFFKMVKNGYFEFEYYSRGWMWQNHAKYNLTEDDLKEIYKEIRINEQH